MRTCVTAATICVLLACADPAWARGDDSVALTLVGTIEPSCSLSMPAGALDLGDVSGAGTADAAIGVSCNAPFILHLASEGGGLVTATPAVPGFESHIAYDASLVVPFDSGGSAASGPCGSDALLAAAPCASLASGTHTAIGQTATLSLSWQAASAAEPRLAGTYQDVIRVSVEFAP